MPSASLGDWVGFRATALDEVDAQCAAVLAAPVPSHPLIDENHRAYVLLLSAHFQGYCRDLHTECAQFVAGHVNPRIEFLVQQAFSKLALDHGNPNLENLKTDFGRFGLTLDLPAADPANPGRISRLGNLNQWRNAAAHHGTPPKNIALNLANIRLWRVSCSGLATSLDRIMYNQLRTLIPRPRPWVP